MKVVGVVIFSILLFGCTHYDNPDRFIPNLGEEFTVYSKINSCCHSCPIETGLQHVKLINRSIVDPIPDDVSGADGTEAFVFQAISTGIDTIKIKTVTGMKNCQLEAGSIQKFVVEVK